MTTSQILYPIIGFIWDVLPVVLLMLKCCLQLVVMVDDYRYKRRPDQKHFCGCDWFPWVVSAIVIILLRSYNWEDENFSIGLINFVEHIIW